MGRSRNRKTPRTGVRLSYPDGRTELRDWKSPSTEVKVRTMGQTPAYKVHGRITIEGLPYPLPTTKDLNVNPSTSQVQNSAFLSPVNTFSLTVISPGVLNQPTIDAINDGKTFRIYTYKPHPVVPDSSTYSRAVRNLQLAW